MKKIFFYSLLLTFLFGGCYKESDPVDTEHEVDHQSIVNEIFKAGMGWAASTKLYKSTTPLNMDIDSHQFGTDGGYIHVKGGITGELSYDEDTNQFLGGVLDIDLTETVVEYTFNNNSVFYTINSLTDFTLTGSATLLPGYQFSSESGIDVNGRARIISNTGFSTIVDVNLKIMFFMDGNGGYVSGTIGDEEVNFEIGV